MDFAFADFQLAPYTYPTSTSPDSPEEQHDEFVIACRRGDVERMKNLLPALTSALPQGVNTLDKLDNTPIYYSIICEQSEAVTFLFDSGAVVDLATANGQRYLLAAQDPKVRELIKKRSIFTGPPALNKWATQQTKTRGPKRTQKFQEESCLSPSPSS